MTAAVAGGYYYGFFQRADNFLYDLHFKWRGSREPSGNITLVLMDQKSAVALKREQGSWSRLHMARAIENLSSADAAVIGIDLVFSAPAPDPEDDRRLAAAIAAGGNVILARILSSHGKEMKALDQFQAAMIGDGFIDVPLDEDSILRKVRFFNARRLADGDLELIPSFSLEVARVFYNIDFIPDFSGNDSFRLGSGKENTLTLPYPELLINYGGNHAAFNGISFSDVVHNRFDPALVKGKVVLIGSSLVFEKDVFSTPYTRFRQLQENLSGKFSSIEKGVLGDKDLGLSCHAWAAETILTREFITKHSRREVFIWTLIAGLVGGVFYLPVTGFLGSTAILLAGLIAFPGISHRLFISELAWLETAPLLAIWSLQFVMGAALQRSVQRRKSLMITDLFGKYLAPDVVRELLQDDLADRLEGHHCDITVMFSDLRGFTSLSEKLGPTRTSRLLNAYFDVMIPLVFKCQGTLDKLIGDAIMAFFGAPLEIEDHPGEAAACALAMLTAIDALRRQDIPGSAELELGIGLNTGRAIVGNLGSKDFMDYTVIGDSVNLASRLESLNKVYGTHIIISEYTAGQIQDRYQLRKLDTVKVIGKDVPVSIYELMASKENCDPILNTLATVYESGLENYRQQ
ncbi:MAG: adenylate/guanylate cyclase domain-containing protein, partial [Desulfobacterales bacterium]|nr:adenylate/guanylate cyclase domain-containing protein [Desulfobacterales bacterium]